MMKKRITFQIGEEYIEMIDDLKQDVHFREISLGGVIRTALHEYLNHLGYVLTSELSPEELAATFGEVESVPKWFRKQDHPKAYNHVRWTWTRRYGVEELTKALRDFDVTKLNFPESRFGSQTVEMMRVSSDTLNAYLSPMRAIIFQTEPQSLTEKDEALRQILFELYNHDRSPITWKRGSRW